MDILNEILEAEKRIRPYILKTPLFPSLHLSKMTGANVFLKLESEQYTGSFKARGSLNKILSLTEEERANGVITASTGNHGLGVARAMSITHTNGLICLPRSASPVKVDAIREYNVPIEFFDGSAIDSELIPFAKGIAKEKNLTWIAPYNDPQIIGGQGTIAIEMFDQLDNIDYVLVTIGGGGLISGIATYLKAKNPHTKIIGCLPENSPEMYLSIKENKFIVIDPPKESLSDGSAGGFEEGSITYELCKELVHNYILISEEEIKEAIKLMVDHHHKIVEGAAGVAIASLIKNKDMFVGKNVAVVVCGANIPTEKLKQII